MIRKLLPLCALALFSISACATIPTGPSVMVMPAPGKSFDQFRQEDAFCRGWAEQQIGISPQAVANQNTATGAAIGTAIGVGAGALIGAASGHSGAGAAIGGATGLLIGASSGADSGQIYGYEAQKRYDIAFIQCMYSYGNQVPVKNQWQQRTYRKRYTPPPRSTYIPPPPPVTMAPYNDPSIPPPPPGATPQTPPELLEWR